MESNRVFEAKNYSEAIQDILGKPPTYLVRWGITIIFSVIVILLLITYFVSYPDIITAPITISNLNPPIRIPAKSSGRIIFLNTNKNVKKGEIVAYIENPASYEDILLLQNILDTLKTNFTASLPNLSLGELQNYFENMQAISQEISSFREFNPVYQQISTIKSQIISLQKVQENAISQKWIIKQELDIAEKQFEREKVLHFQKVISSQDFEKAEMSLLQQKRAFKNIEATILNNELRIAELQNRIAELQSQIVEKETKLYASFQNSFQNLKSQYAIWKAKYVLESPSDGKLSYLKHFAMQEYIRSEQEIAVVIPNAKNNIGKINLPLNNSGKIRKGQKVNIKLYNFPAEEFGILEGRIDEINLILQEGEKGEKIYHLSIALPENLQTTYQKNLPNTAELQGEASIITADLRLIERLFYQITKVFR